MASTKAPVQKNESTQPAFEAAVLPIVSTKTREVFLQLITRKAPETIEAITSSIAEKRFVGLGNELRAFAKDHEHVKVWNSKAARVSAKHLSKSHATQVEFWKRSGFTIVNLKEMVEDAKVAVAKAKSTKKPAAKAVKQEEVTQ